MELRSATSGPLPRRPFVMKLPVRPRTLSTSWSPVRKHGDELGEPQRPESAVKTRRRDGERCRCPARVLVGGDHRSSGHGLWPRAKGSSIDNGGPRQERRRFECVHQWFLRRHGSRRSGCARPLDHRNGRDRDASAMDAAIEERMVASQRRMKRRNKKEITIPTAERRKSQRRDAVSSGCALHPGRLEPAT